jgi:hypothetical protein
MRKAIRWSLIFGFAFLTNYVGAYYALADREPLPIGGGLHFDPSPCRYHFGPVNANGLAGVFRPMHSVDRAIRPAYWSDDAGGFRVGDDLGGPAILVEEE